MDRLGTFLGRPTGAPAVKDATQVFLRRLPVTLIGAIIIGAVAMNRLRQKTAG